MLAVAHFKTRLASMGYDVSHVTEATLLSLAAGYYRAELAKIGCHLPTVSDTALLAVLGKTTLARRQAREFRRKTRVLRSMR